MEQRLTVTGIAGSIRRQAYSQAALRSLAALLPAQTNYAELAIGAFPHYDQDLDGEAAPAAVADARARIAASDAVLIVTPEFNHGIPGVLKNALDWLSRPAFTSCFVGKPVLFASIGPGALGGVRAQYQLRETLAAMLCRMAPLKELIVPEIAEKISEGRLTDARTIAHFDAALERFLAELTARGPA
ncbi:NADPH-dependent FMN reductase [Acidisoma sp. 7E03]